MMIMMMMMMMMMMTMMMMMMMMMIIIIIIIIIIVLSYWLQHEVSHECNYPLTEELTAIPPSCIMLGSLPAAYSLSRGEKPHHTIRKVFYGYVHIR